MTEELECLLNKAISRAGYTNRSDFIRDAIKEKAATVGVEIPAILCRAPSRLNYETVPQEKSFAAEKRTKSGAPAEGPSDAAISKNETYGRGLLGAKAGVAKLGLKSKAVSPTGKKGGPTRPAPRPNSVPQSPPEPVPTGPVS